MKKMFRVISLAFVMLFVTGIRVDAHGDYSCRVIDACDLLTQQQEEELNEKLEEIYSAYNADGVILILDFVDADEREAAALFMQEYDVGGTDNNAMCLLHQAEARNVSLVFRGELQYDFDEKIQDLMLDDCVEELSEDNYFEAYKAIITDYEKGLERVAAGKKIRPMDMEGAGGFAAFLLKAFLISLAAAAVPVLCMTLFQRSRMKTSVPQTNADFYTEPGGLEMDVSRDIYLHTATTRIHINRDRNTHGGGGRGGSFSAGGESFSGSSRKY